nr:MAG TPA: hypothetical protein [Bacteriophage sp.]
MLSLSTVRLSHFLIVLYHKRKQIASVKLHKKLEFWEKVFVQNSAQKRDEIFVQHYH